MRINRFVAQATGKSRRQADELVKQGRISINGRPAHLGSQVNDSDQVSFQGQTLEIMPSKSIMLYKPINCVSSRRRQGDTPTIYDLLPDKLANLKTAGRLDKNTSGLMILSDDGQLILELSHPKYNKEKRYWAELDKPLANEHLAALEQGVKLKDGLSQVKVIEHRAKRINIGLGEGRNRQIRRTFAALGYQVHKLHRYQLGKFKLDLEHPGDWRYLAAEELS